MTYYELNDMYDLSEPSGIDVFSDTPVGITRLSKSSVQVYLDCPYKFFLKYIQNEIKVPFVTDYPRLCGTMVHRFLASLHGDHKHLGRFYYKTINAAIGAWSFMWKKALEENKDFLIHVNSKEAEKYRWIGINCIRNYWNISYDKPDPTIIEKKYTIPWCPGFEFTGVFDQVRPVSIDLINLKRPDLIVNGILDERYDPVTIVDLKTGYYDYEVSPDSSEVDKVRHQYDLQRNTQASAYTLLYRISHSGKLPLYFTLHQLKNNKFFTVIGEDEESQQNLRDSVNHVILGIKNNSFPRNIGPNCRRCDYTFICSQKKTINISDPDGKIDSTIYLPMKKEKSKMKQGRLKFK